MDKVKHGRPEGSGSLVSGIGEYEPGRMSLKLGAKEPTLRQEALSILWFQRGNGVRLEKD